jgi:hypothetical protein
MSSTANAAAGARPLTFERFASVCAILAALTGLSYALAFVVFHSALYAGLSLMIGGLLGTAIVVAISERLRVHEPAFAMLGLILGAAASLGAVVHGGFDLANALHPPTNGFPADLPNTVDPRGLLVFGARSLWVFLFMWLAAQRRALSSWTIWLGYASAILSFALYAGRLFILDPTNLAIGGPALVEGFVVHPVFLLFVARDLSNGVKRA